MTPVASSVAYVHVRNIVWEPAARPKQDPPIAILFEFDNYVPDGNDDLLEADNCVPIFRSVRDFINGSTTCQRIQFLLTPAYALTIHKSQGITVDQAVVGMSDRDFAVGLTYVAASRVRTLKGLMFEDTFHYQRIATSGGVTAANRGADRLLCLPQQIHPPATPRHGMGWTQHNTLSSQASL
jgi:hypothetical protein